jgi:hypothetical protein
MTVLRVGAGREIITPPVGSMLMGYAPARPAESVHDDLAVTAIALEQDGCRALLMSADVCVIREPQSGHARRCVSDATGVPFEHIILAATHTHSGPAMRGTPGGADIDETYIAQIFEPGCVRAATAALKALKPARMGVGTTLSDVGINRRGIDRNGRVGLGQNPWGIHDPIMTVVSFRGIDGTPIANLVHYGAHCTAAGKNPEITRDWAGPMVDRLRAESGAVSVFFNGAEGDCGPRLSNAQTTGKNDIAYALELGSRAAIDAVRAYRGIRDYRDVSLGVISDRIALPYAPFPTLDELEEELAAMGDPSQLSGLRVMAYKTLLARIAKRKEGGPFETHMHLDQTLLALGPVAFVPFQFEVFSELTLRVRQHSPFQHTLSLSNANGSYFYFPSREQIARGGYEVWVFKSMNVFALADDADDAAVSDNLRLLDALAEEKTQTG